MPTAYRPTDFRRIALRSTGGKVKASAVVEAALTRIDVTEPTVNAFTDIVAERARKLGGTTLHSIGHILRTQRILDNDADFVAPADMLAELRDDNATLVARMRELHEMLAECRDVVTTSLLETWIDEAERRTWFLFEATRG